MITAGIGSASALDPEEGALPAATPVPPPLLDCTPSQALPTAGSLNPSGTRLTAAPHLNGGGGHARISRWDAMPQPPPPLLPAAQEGSPLKRHRSSQWSPPRPPSTSAAAPPAAALVPEASYVTGFPEQASVPAAPISLAALCRDDSRELAEFFASGGARPVHAESMVCVYMFWSPLPSASLHAYLSCHALFSF